MILRKFSKIPNDLWPDNLSRYFQKLWFFACWQNLLSLACFISEENFFPKKKILFVSHLLPQSINLLHCTFKESKHFLNLILQFLFSHFNDFAKIVASLFFVFLFLLLFAIVLTDCILFLSHFHYCRYS